MPEASILIIDDDILITNTLALRLEKNDYEILIANNGKEALKKLEGFIPDVIILDVIMPGMSGYEVLKNIKENEKLMAIPVIMLTGKGNLDDKIVGLDKGADDYLAKPFDPRELQARVEVLLRLKNLEKELVKSERLAVVGHLALNIKARIDTPLDSIIKKSENVIQLTEQSDLKKRVNHILNNSLRIKRILSKLEKLEDTPVIDYLTGIKMIDLSHVRM